MASKQKAGSSMDDDEPKRPLTAYTLWLKANKEEVKKKFPNAKKSYLKRAAGMWKKLEDKSYWENQAKKAREDYDDAVEAFESGGPTSNKRKQPAKKEESGKKAKKDKGEAADNEGN